MKRWFAGNLVAHYRGTASAEPGILRRPEASHFRLEIYRALVTEVELLGDTDSALAGREGAHHDAIGDRAPLRATASEGDPTEGSEGLPEALPEAPSPEAPEPASTEEVELRPQAEAPHFFQPHISITHLVDAGGPGRTVLTTARDVRVSSVRLSHPATAGERIYGRMEGTISGWFNPPPDPPEPEIIAPASVLSPYGIQSQMLPLPGGDAGGRAVPSPGKQRGVSPSGSGRAKGHWSPESPLSTEAPSLEDPGTGSEEVLPKGAFQPTDEAATSPDRVEPERPAVAEPPFFLAGSALFALLLFVATPLSAGIWAGAFLPSLGLRKWLLGVVPDAGGVRLLALATTAGQLLVGALLMAGWASAGCVSLSPLPLLLLLGGVFASSLLPRPLTYGVAAGVFAVVLLSAYGPWAPPSCH